MRNSDTLISMAIHDSVPREEIGLFLQQCINDGAVLVVITQNPDHRTCTVRVQPE